MKPIPTETATDVGSVGKWLGAAAAGALLMYVLDPERGRARRQRALSAVVNASGRAGATVDTALHNAGERLVDLKDSAASALSRGADRLQAEAAPLLERAQHGAQQAARRIEHEAERARDSAAASRASARAERNTYESDRHYSQAADSYRERGGLSQLLQGLGDALGGARGQNSALLGGSMVGLLGLMRRSPAALVVGLAGLYLLTRGAGKETYRVSDMSRGKLADERESAPYVPAGAEPGKHYLH